MESDVSSSAGKVLNIQVVHRKALENLKKNETAMCVKDFFQKE